MFLVHTTVDARECVLRYRGGMLRDVLGTGRHRRVLGARLVRVDLREQLLTLAAQEVLTTDGVSAKVTAVVRWSVADAVAFHERSADPVGHVYLAAQVALRDALAALTAEQLVGRGSAVPGGEMTAATAESAERVGVSVAEVVVKDVILPAEVRAAAAELVTTRQRGLARLEAARAESAALRSLANGARLLDAHPALATLRVVQSAPAGTQLVLRLEPPASEPPAS
jgi:regulator of protease activity HflC (stomatin/prohibitin superfamily)